MIYIILKNVKLFNLLSILELTLILDIKDKEIIIYSFLYLY